MIMVVHKSITDEFFDRKRNNNLLNNKIMRAKIGSVAGTQRIIYPFDFLKVAQVI